MIAWISANFLGGASGHGVAPEDVHPTYPSFAKDPILIGNKVSPPRAYLYAPHVSHGGDFPRKAIESRLGPGWKGHPRDVEGNVITRRR